MSNKYYTIKGTLNYYREYQGRFETWMIWDSEQKETTYWRWDTSWFNDKDQIEIVKRKPLIEIKPKMYNCKKCNNKGCFICKRNPFSIWNKFHEHK